MNWSPIKDLHDAPAIGWPAFLIWMIVWVLLFFLDPLLDLANLSMLLLLGSVTASLWLTPVYSVVASTLFVVAFNWFFVFPRGSLHVALDKDLLLLVTMAVVNGLIAALMFMNRQAAIKVNDHRLRTTFLTSVSHDFRTPLATIVGSASVLQEEFVAEGNPDRVRSLSVIIEQANQLNRIANNVLQLVRLDEKSLTVKKDWESAEEIIGSAVHLCRQRAPNRTIEASVHSYLPLVWCNALLLVQLLENLIDNALKYSPPTQPVFVKAFREGKDIVFCVVDRGTGIAPELSKTIFQAFERVEPEGIQLWQLEDPTARGVGIGLTLCQAIVRAHQGTIELSAPTDGGSIFTVRLPLRDNLTAPPEL
jgi:K+-sensing histidine kinase KdpD